MTDSQKSSLGHAPIAAAKNHEQDSTAASRKTRGNSAHVPQSEKYHCALCSCYIVNKKDLISQHEGSRKHKDAVEAAQAKATKRWRCETCNEDFPSTPDAVESHMKSHEHQRMTMYAAEPNRDGPSLHKQQQKLNGNKRAAPQ